MSSSPTPFTDLLERALDRRAGLIAALQAEATDAYRLFHGSVEGVPGLTVDRYGAVLLSERVTVAVLISAAMVLSGLALIRPAKKTAPATAVTVPASATQV